MEGCAWPGLTPEPLLRYQSGNGCCEYGPVSILRHSLGGAPQNPITTVALALALAALAGVVWFHRPDGGRIGALSYPAESAGRLVERDLSLYAGDYAALPGWERSFFTLLFGDRAQVERHGIRVYRDVLGYFNQRPQRATAWAVLNTRIRLMVLLAESGRTGALRAELDGLDPAPEQQAVAEALAFAYHLDAGPDRLTPMALAGLRLLPLGWAADRMWLHASERAGDQATAARYRRLLQNAGREARTRVVLFAGLNAALIGAGLLLALIWWRRGGAGLGWRARALERPWSLGEGFAVFVRAGTLGLIIFVLLAAFSGSLFHPRLLALWSGLFASLPMIWLIRRFLLAPRGLGYTTAFGLDARRRLLGTLGAALAVLAVEQAGSLLIAWGGWKLGLHSPWSEGIPERLIWAPWSTTVLGTLDTVAWGPVFEEIGFRGLVYVTLRARMGPLPAALLSAGLFAGLHPYSPAAMLAVLWSGLVWALAFERLRSLLPGILAHMGTNLLAVSTVLLFYR